MEIIPTGSGKLFIIARNAGPCRSPHRKLSTSSRCLHSCAAELDHAPATCDTAWDRIDGGGPQRIDPVPVAPVSVPRGDCRYARPYCAGGCGGRSSGTLEYRDLAHVPGVGSHFRQRGCFLPRATLPGPQTSTWDAQTAHDAIQFLPLRVFHRSSRARAILTATKM